MDHSLKSVVLLQDQLLQIFFEQILLNPKKPEEAPKPQVPATIPEVLIKETKREDQLSQESNQMEEHNVFADKQSSIESVLSKKESEADFKIQKKQMESDEDEFHDIYEARQSRNVMFQPKNKMVNINLNENTVHEVQNTKKSVFGWRESKKVAGQKEPKLAAGVSLDLRTIMDRLTILVIGYHNFAVELEYLGRW